MKIKISPSSEGAGENNLKTYFRQIFCIFIFETKNNIFKIKMFQRKITHKIDQL